MYIDDRQFTYILLLVHMCIYQPYKSMDLFQLYSILIFLNTYLIKPYNSCVRIPTLSLMNPNESYVKNAIVDECFQPVLEEFYKKQFREQDFQLLNQQLMQASSVNKHEALIGIYNLLTANRNIITKIISSGVLFKVIFYLKEEQFSQLCFESLRILYLIVTHGKIAQYLVNCGGVNSLLNLVKEDNNKIIVGLSLFVLLKTANKVGGLQFNYPQHIGVNDFIVLAEEGNKQREVNGVLVHLMLQLWRNQMFLRPEDTQRIKGMVFKQIIKVNIQQERLIKDSFKLLSSSQNNLYAVISENGWGTLKEVIANLQGKQNYVLAHYLKFLTAISIQQKMLAFKQMLISLDVLKVFQNLLNDDEEKQYLFCFLVYDILDSHNYNGVKYFLQKTSVLIKFYYLVQSGSTKIKKSICSIFALLTAFKSQEVLLLYEQAKIVAVYLRLMKENQNELAEICLKSLVQVLTFVESMSLTTFNWFINYLKTEKAEATFEELKGRTESPTIKVYIQKLLQFFIEKEKDDS